MELEVRHLRALCAIADTGSLHRAARQLGVAQPSLSTQLRRIEQELGGALFLRARSGCRPTPLGRLVLSRARPLVAEMRSLVAEARAAAAGGTDLRIGSTASKALGGWLRRLRGQGQDPTLQMNVSPNALLRMVADGQLDLAFVHEVEGCPLRIPPELRLRVLVEREPQFVSLPADHPAAAATTAVDPRDLAGDRWMIDSSVDGEWDAVQRMFRAAGVSPLVQHGDYHTAGALVATGEVITVCQPTAAGPDMAVRPLRGDPIGVRLLTAARTETELDGVFPALEEAYWEVARLAPAYREWLEHDAVRQMATPVPALPPDLLRLPQTPMSLPSVR